MFISSSSSSSSSNHHHRHHAPSDVENAFSVGDRGFPDQVRGRGLSERMRQNLENSEQRGSSPRISNGQKSGILRRISGYASRPRIPAGRGQDRQ